MNRRDFLSAATAAIPVAMVLSPRLFAATEGNFEVTRTKAEWQAMLSETEYAVMREEATERAGTSPLNDEKRAGTYACKGCDLPLYSSETKYDSGTGWPSFWQSLPDAIGTKEDRKLFSVRTECHCRRCGSHLGHIFDDGPAPTGKRHCLNGVSLTFLPA
ncbi:peptide-methionine (R)-S-oxide reductase MsrB [Vannielia sp. SX4]|uniref:peptide-methionine (R)-S-oxide reductase MsrB n=1 Tax=Vannielia sp. SX4 TaxID=3463852 RepID=UPI00405810AF